ncbi:nucleotidyltransferase family protein [Bacteroides acidifaciens]|jgi:dTDP-glucose pyrophosphorylase|uniref:nucleotidyltransferase family protein n=1 Tax=Bacteroides acidifaciens TaxID=85831 RepID=UPI0023D69EAD|nr:sugar phosphate nucleotidyltransferase [Bacteroides acidifaciens]MCI9515742.1 nucleotidyltransferase [Lachnospiraceae bacterium]MCI9660667.1 nucleotidyltransferase [Lachnospiraceae bacterium]MDE6908324.1 nucleotidyltransferase [Lachnospiraceae bacterium]
MKNTTLVIMAAGLGSRFGSGIKQLEPFGPNGEIIMDYSIYDALAAGFNKIVFIIRRSLEKDFKEVIGNRIEKIANVVYAYQELDDLPAGFTVPEGRTKPWGTGQAILCCKDIVDEPFIVINADDYYGKEAFVKLHDYLINPAPVSEALNFCMAGFILGNTLSDNGSVTRGICHVNSKKHLLGVKETHDIYKTENGAGVPNGTGGFTPIDPKSIVSMNMWGFTPELFDILEKGFSNFLSDITRDGLKAEYLIPTVVDSLIKNGTAQVTMLETNDKWFGVTYREDKENVVKSLRKLIDAGIYPEKLF